VWDSWHFWWY